MEDDRKIYDIGIKASIRLLIDDYYLFIIGVYMLTFIIPNLPAGKIASVVMVGIGIMLLSQLNGVLRGNRTIVLGIVFLLYCIVVTVVNIALGESNLLIFIRAASNSLLPMIFMFAGYNGIFFSRKRFLAAINICCLVGIPLMIIRPMKYIQYCLDYGYSYKRLSSCIGSTAVGTLAVVALLLSISQCIEHRCKRGKIQYVLSLGYAVLSMQRSAWIVVMLSLIFMHYYVFVKWKVINKKYFFLEIVSVAAVLVLFRNILFYVFSSWYAEQLTSGNKGMFDSRIEQWIYGIKNSQIILGSGYGSRGHKSASLGDVVADGSWVLLLCEVGIVGLALFLGIIFSSLMNGRKNLKKNIVPVMVILVICLQSIGSNMFEYQIIMPLFWMSIGAIAGCRKFERCSVYESAGYVSSAIS